MPGLTALEELDLRENKLQSLPDGISGMVSLKKLNLNINQLTELT